jgi:hypothetical protein
MYAKRHLRTRRAPSLPAACEEARVLVDPTRDLLDALRGLMKARCRGFSANDQARALMVARRLVVMPGECHASDAPSRAILRSPARRILVQIGVGWMGAMIRNPCETMQVTEACLRLVRTQARSRTIATQLLNATIDRQRVSSVFGADSRMLTDPTIVLGAEQAHALATFGEVTELLLLSGWDSHRIQQWWLQPLERGVRLGRIRSRLHADRMVREALRIYRNGT